MPVCLAPPAIVVSWQDPQPPIQVPRTDVTVEVIGELPIADNIQTVTRLLSVRHAASSNRRYLPTALELIMLVKTNPVRPRGRQWDSVHALTIRYLPDTGQVRVEYCIDHCDFDQRTGAFDPRREMVMYSAAASVVEKRVTKKLRELQKYAER